MSFLEKLKAINTFIFDVDGVLTDGTILVAEDGHYLRTFNIKDGYSVQLAVKKNYNVVIISGGTSPSVEKRLKALGVNDIYLGVSNKVDVMQNYLKINNISLDQVLYMGDDIPDFVCMKQVSIAACPNDAALEIQQISNYISPKAGGKGAVRDIIEKVLKSQNKWFDDEQGFVW